MRIFIVVGLLLVCLNCQKTAKNLPENRPIVAVQPIQTETVKPKIKVFSTIEIPKLANKPAAEFDAVFGKAFETKAMENGGEYRLYKAANYPKGLAVRFYGGKAKSFNLILETPAANSKDALRQNFGIDVGNATFAKDAKEPLSEVFRGNFGGVKFSKFSAKKKENGSGFIFVLAEIE